jgi:hypothetical protein
MYHLIEETQEPTGVAISTMLEEISPVESMPIDRMKFHMAPITAS